MNLITLTIAFLLFTIAEEKEIIIHSDMSFEEAIDGTSAPKEVIDDLRLIDVKYYNFKGEFCKGQLLMHKDLEKDIIDAFKIIEERKFPVKSVIPIVKYDWSDNASMEDNNTSGFNYRFVAGTKRLSNHSYGRAIDINPETNPAIYKSGEVAPKGAKYIEDAPGALNANSEITKFFIERGWDWGGNWTSLKDYQHFDKED